MERNESEKIIQETIEYANQEIEKVKKKSVRIIIGMVAATAILAAICMFVFVYEIPVEYADGLVEATIPVDGGIDIHVNLKNYTQARAVLIDTEDGFDLYIGVTQTLAAKLLKDFDSHDNFLRVANGIILDHQSERLWGFIPEGKDESSMSRIYYLNDLREEMTLKENTFFIDHPEKILIWERTP